MDEIIDRLLLKLCAKGLTDREVPRLVRDVLNILNDDQTFYTLETFNHRLATLGWREDLLDPYVFELILRVLEEERGQGEPAAQATVTG